MNALNLQPAKGLGRVRSHGDTDAALLATGAVGAAVFTVLITASADVYQAVTSSSGLSGLDGPTLDLAISLRTPDRNQRVTAFTHLGSAIPMAFIALTLTATMYLHWRRRAIPLLMVIAATGSLLFTSVGKTVVGRARPPHYLAVPPYEYAPSFPSGHTLNSTVIALMAAYFAWWLSEKLWVRILCPALGGLWATAMGLSRVYLGHHWITDVIFAWLLGLAWLALLITVHQILLRLDDHGRRTEIQTTQPANHGAQGHSAGSLRRRPSRMHCDISASCWTCRLLSWSNTRRRTSAV